MKKRKVKSKRKNMKRKDKALVNAVDRAMANIRNVKSNTVEGVLIKKEYMNVEKVFICYEDLSVEEMSREIALSERVREYEVTKVWNEDGLCLKVKLEGATK